jgi:hypothetical protein
MPKRVPFRYEPMIVLDTTSSVPLYRQLYDRLRLAILTGQLATGDDYLLHARLLTSSEFLATRSTLPTSSCSQRGISTAKWDTGPRWRV